MSDEGQHYASFRSVAEWDALRARVEELEGLLESIRDETPATWISDRIDAALSILLVTGIQHLRGEQHTKYHQYGYIDSTITVQHAQTTLPLCNRFSDYRYDPTRRLCPGITTMFLSGGPNAAGTVFTVITTYNLSRAAATHCAPFPGGPNEM